MSKTVQSIKEKIHERIESIDDEKVLEAFYVILNSHKNEAEDYQLSDEQIKMLEERDAEYQRGEMKTVTLEEFRKETKDKFGYEV